MKLRYWVIIWSAIAAACFAAVIITKTSYTSLSPQSKEVTKSMYGYWLDLLPVNNTDYSTLAKNAELVVKGRFDGKRILANEACLSEVKISKVFKGDDSFSGKSFEIYEPIHVQRDKNTGNPGYNDYQKMVKHFNWQGKKWIVMSNSSGNDCFSGYTPMNSECEYLLFLKRQESFSDKKSGYFAQIESPYSKIMITNSDASAYKKPEEYISFDEASKYEILLNHDKKIKKYFDSKINILKSLGLI